MKGVELPSPLEFSEPAELAGERSKEALAPRPFSLIKCALVVSLMRGVLNKTK
jgi:hypothetical protein